MSELGLLDGRDAQLKSLAGSPIMGWLVNMSRLARDHNHRDSTCSGSQLRLESSSNLYHSAGSDLKHAVEPRPTTRLSRL